MDNTRLGPDRNRVPALDGIRAVAVTAVLISHFVSDGNVLNRHVQWGRIGVLMFFVLSGFLITGILLEYRDQQIKGIATKSTCFRVFYARRILRISPIYYIAILGLLVAGYPPVTRNPMWLLTYSMNISIAFFHGVYGNASHLWSLCVEEQFYLVWPALIMLVSARYLHRLIIFMILGGVAYRLIGSLSGLSWTATAYMLPGCLDSLGVGALLALYRHDPSTYHRSRMMLMRIGLLFGLPLLIGLQILWAYQVRAKTNPLYATLIDLAASLTFVVLIDVAANNSRSIVSRILSLPPAQYMGRISYGIYLYHFFLIPYVPRLLRRFGLEPPTSGRTRFILYSAIAIIIAAVSWHVIERPLSRLKSYSPYFRIPSRHPSRAAA